MHWGDFVAEQSLKYSPLVVGIDPVKEQLPLFFEGTETSNVVSWMEKYVEFLLSTIAGRVGFIKIQSAFFEAFGSDGVSVLARSMEQASRVGLGIILDVKRGDIGSTSKAYAQAYLLPKEHGGVSDLVADCITVNPFLGRDTLEPFLTCVRDYGKGIFILAKTSNEDSGWIQDQDAGDGRISDQIASYIAKLSQDTIGNSGLSSIGAVVGATNLQESKRLRQLMPNSIMLVPGLGAQGGNIQVIRNLRRPSGDGVLVPVSRGITKVEDRKLDSEQYRSLILRRIDNYIGILKI